MLSGGSGKGEIDRSVIEGPANGKIKIRIKSWIAKSKQKGGEIMLNQCTLTGNLGGDPEVFYSSEGSPVASFSLAFHSSKKKTGWIKVVCFQKLAEVTTRIEEESPNLHLRSEQS